MFLLLGQIRVYCWVCALHMQTWGCSALYKKMFLLCLSELHEMCYLQAIWRSVVLFRLFLLKDPHAKRDVQTKQSDINVHTALIRAQQNFRNSTAIAGHIFPLGATAPTGPRPPPCQGFTNTPHSVGLLWTSDQPDIEKTTWQHVIQQIDIHAPGGIQTRNPSKRAAADTLLRLRGHWDRHSWTLHWWRYGSVSTCRH